MSSTQEAYDTGSSGVSHRRRKMAGNRRSWSKQEETVLIASLKELVAQGFKTDNGFRGNHLQRLQDAMVKKFPTTDLKGQPHINSKLTSWKKLYYSLNGILSRSGIGFNVRGNFMIDCEDDQWEQIIKMDPNARPMRFKSWPLYDDWKYIFGKDRATGETAEDVLDAYGESGDQTNTIDDGIQSTNEVELEHLAKNEVDADTVSRTPKTSNMPSLKAKKRKVSEDVSAIKDVMSEIGKTADERLASLAEGIGYEAQLGKARKEAFNYLGIITKLSIDDRLDVCEILAKHQDKLEIYMGLPEIAIPVFVDRLLRNKGA